MKHKQVRCAWVPKNDELYQSYHDLEWGVPVWDDKIMFEFLVLETFQAGLSWRVVLNKRQAFKTSFANFDYKHVAKFTDQEVEKLIKNPTIIRNILKIKATVSNARAFLNIQKEFESFSKYLWARVKNKPINGKRKSVKDMPDQSVLSAVIAKDLKARGFKFLGPVVVYSHLQAVGIINDHTIDCFRYKELR